MAMDDVFDRRVEETQSRLSAMRDQLAEEPPEEGELITEALGELSTTLEELHVATEELREQNDELVQTRGALEAERHRYQELFDFAPNGYLVTDRLGKIEEANHAAAAMLSLRRDFLKGKPIIGFVVAEDRKDLHKQMIRLEEVADSAVEWEMRFQGREGPPFVAAVRVGRIRDPDGSLRGLRWLLLDISPRKELEDELQRLYQNEKQVSARLKSLDEIKDAFLQAVSHELRSPVTSVIGYASVLAREGRDLPDVTRTEALRQLSASARKLDTLLRDLLDLDRLSRGIVEPRPRRTDVAEIVRRIVEESGLSSSPNLEIEAPPSVADVDVPMVERIIDNLVGNALRHASAGTRVWIKVIAEGDGVLLEVDDDGPGVPDHLKEDIFRPFSRGDAGALVPGTGVGLALVARFARLHGGRAWVEDRPGGGASFKVFLPAPEVAKSAGP